MEDVTENSVVNPDQDLNEDGVSSSNSLTTALAQTETQGARVTCENNKVETDSQEKDCEQRNEITASLSGESKLLPIQHSGEESNGKDHLHERDGQDETKNEDENNDSGTEEPRKQTCLEALEIEGTITEASGTNENLNSNVSEENDLSCNIASDGGYTNQTESPSIASQRLEDSVVDEDTGNEDKPSSDELTSRSEQRALESTYQIKWIKWKGIDTPIITQNENGPCPLLAIVNVLLLQRRVNIPSSQEIVTSGQLMEYIGDCILEESPKRLTEGAQLNYEQNMNDAIAIMDKLQTGLDVNVKFTGITEFEFTPECVVFDLLSIGLYHGWLVDPQNADTCSAIGGVSYNQLVEKIIASKQDGAESKLVSEGLIGEAFLEETASQLTYHGLCELNLHLQDDQLGVFFRNNHFSTFHKHKDQLFLLVTDQGFLTEDRVIWESLSNVEGDSYFVDAEFRLLPTTQSTAPAQPSAHLPPMNQQLSLEDQDYLVALTLQQEQDGPSTQSQHSQFESQAAQTPMQQITEADQEWADCQLAMQLQEEERAHHQQMQQQQHRQRQPQQVMASTVRPRNLPSPGQPQQQRTQSSEKCIVL